LFVFLQKLCDYILNILEQLIVDFLDHAKVSTLTFVYDEDDALIMWKDFLEQNSKQVVPPSFVKIVDMSNDQEAL